MNKNLTISILSALFVFCVLCTNHAEARKPLKNAPYHAKQVKEALEDYIQFPGCSMRNIDHGEAVVVFSISDDGKIEIDEMTANCIALEENLKEQLKDFYFKEVVHPYNQHYKVRFTFLFT